MTIKTKFFLAFQIIQLLFLVHLQGQTNDSYMEGGNIENPSKCMPEELRENIKQQIHENRIKLNLHNQTSREGLVVDDLIFPMQMASSIPGYYNFYSISGYVDHDSSNKIADFNCLKKTYDTHKGTDFFTFPFNWYLYENDLVEVIAAAAGTIVLKQDGHTDTNCSPMGNWNAVYIQHADGSTIWYGHLKSGSPTSKNIGETVAQGEYLGVVASSGFSSGPHLHLEYYDENDQLLDPFQGTCNLRNSNSLWSDQRAHTNSQVNAILTHNIRPNIECGLSNEVAGLANSFQPNDDLYVGVYITDYPKGIKATTSIYRPDNSLYHSFNTFNNDSSFGLLYHFKKYTLLDSDLRGTWRIECEFNGQVYTHSFEFSDELTGINELSNFPYDLYPNPSSGLINIKGIDLGDFHYEITNIVGALKQKGKITQNQISIEALQNGVYILSIINADDQIYNVRIVKY